MIILKLSTKIHYFSTINYIFEKKINQNQKKSSIFISTELFELHLVIYIADFQTIKQYFIATLKYKKKCKLFSTSYSFIFSNSNGIFKLSPATNAFNFVPSFQYLIFFGKSNVLFLHSKSTFEKFDISKVTATGS